MFGMNQKMMESLLKSQLSKIKKIQVEIEKEDQKSSCQIIDQKIQQGLPLFNLKINKQEKSLKFIFAFKKTNLNKHLTKYRPIF